jgi:hypothetical protein
MGIAKLPELRPLCRASTRTKSCADCLSLPVCTAALHPSASAEIRFQFSRHMSCPLESAAWFPSSLRIRRAGSLVGRKHQRTA